MIHATLALLLSLVLLWQNRPQLNEDPDNPIPGNGNASALFTAGLLLALAAAMAVLASLVSALATNPDYQQAADLLEQLALFAALPLLVINGLVRALDYDWSRMIWGRILLVVCAMFAITRSSEWLDYWMLVILAAGVLTFVLPIIKRGDKHFIAILLYWCVVCAGYFSLDLRQPTGMQHWSWLGLSLLPYITCSNRWLSLSSLRSK